MSITIVFLLVIRLCVSLSVCISFSLLYRSPFHLFSPYFLPLFVCLSLSALSLSSLPALCFLSLYLSVYLFFLLFLITHSLHKLHPSVHSDRLHIALAKEEERMGDKKQADLHHQMCKKIAQLTKVIYAMNTKNDEHECEMKAMKDDYETQIQQVFVFSAFLSSNWLLH